MKNSNVIKIITSILTVFNLCATIYYIKSNHSSTKKLRKIQGKLNTIKDNLNDITEELEELTEELDKKDSSKDKKKLIEETIDTDGIADIDEFDDEDLQGED